MGEGISRMEGWNMVKGCMKREEGFQERRGVPRMEGCDMGEGAYQGREWKQGVDVY
jgi:hypothetical protein